MVRIHNPAWSDVAPATHSESALTTTGSLSGKRLAVLYNGWEKWQLMLNQLKEVLVSKYPDIKIEQFLIPRGYAAPDELLNDVINRFDLALVGLGNCGSCTAWSHHDSVTIRSAGLPTVWVISKEFQTLANNLRLGDRFSDIELPTFTLPIDPEIISDEEGQKIMATMIPQIIDGLTGEWTPAAVEPSEAEPESTVPRYLEISDEDFDGFGHLYESGQTDGLPILLPTERRVAAMLAALGKVDPNEVVAYLPPMMGAATYERIATVAAMAGCDPSYMPILVAQVKAVAVPEFNLHGISTTTASSSPLTILNGPMRTKIGVNSGRGLMGPGWRSNATIGRFLRLLMINVGGVTPGEISKSVMGSPSRYTFAFGENEEASPWEPLHVSRGFSADDSTVTVIGAMSTINVSLESDPESMLICLGDALAFFGNNNVTMGRGSVVAIVTPGQADILSKSGLSKRDVQEGIFEAARIPLANFPKNVKPKPPNEWIEHDGQVQVVRSPDHIFVVVAGGPEPRYAHVIATHPSVVPITRSVEGQQVVGPLNKQPVGAS